MKKLIVTAMLAAACTMTFAACNTGNTNTAPEETKVSEMVEEQVTQAGETEDAKLTVNSINENVDPFKLEDGTYHVEVDFSNMKKTDNGTVLNFGIYTPVHYEKKDLENLKKGQMLRVHWGPTEDESEVLEVKTVEVKDGFVKVNGGIDQGGYDFMLDDSGYYRVHRESDATYYDCHGFVEMEVPNTVNFEDSYATPNEVRTIEGSKLYDHFKALSKDEKSGFTQNCTYITIVNGVITEFFRVYVP